MKQERERRREVERQQYKKLRKLSRYIDRGGPLLLDDTELEALGLVRGTDLDVDNCLVCDFEPRFFSPLSNDDAALQEEVAQRGAWWRESWTANRHNDPEWAPPSSYTVPERRAEWFGSLVEMLSVRIRRRNEPHHPINTYKWLDQEDVRFPSPMGLTHPGHSVYMTGGYQVPAAADKPHMTLEMLDPRVAPEGKLLGSELDAIVTLLRQQNRSGAFTDHHTKPVLIYTFQWETHARLTQAHMDPTTHKIVIRQSRQLDLRGAQGQPPADAELLLRWMLNSPVGTTKYEELPVAEGDGDGGACGRDVREAAAVVVEVPVVGEVQSPARVRVEG